MHQTWLIYLYIYGSLQFDWYTLSYEAMKSKWIEFLYVQWTQIDTKCTCDCFPINFDLTATALLFQYQVGSSKSKHQFRRTSPPICLCTVASSDQQLYIYSHFLLIVLIMPRPTRICIRHDVLAIAWEGMWKSTIACRVCLTCAIINRILQKHTATRILLPGKSMGIPGKTTPCQFRALLKMVQRIASHLLGPWRRGWGICM